MDECSRKARFRAAGLFFTTFIVAGGVALLNEWFVGIVGGWRHTHTLSHYFFGLGFPLAWASIIVSPRAEKLKGWRVELAGWCDQHYKKGFWIGAAITEIWSIWNELLVYLMRNPSHALDWHHWIADLSGIFTAFLVYRWMMQPVQQAEFCSCVR